MNKEIAMSNVQELLLGEMSIPVQLRMHKGLDKAQFEVLTESIEYLIQEYKNELMVPKKLALAFVDISNLFYYSEDDYPENELEEIEDAGNALSSLANELFDVDE